MPRALVVALLLLLPSAPAAAQSYDSSFRFGLGLDYGGLFGRNDGGAGGLRVQVGARVHEYLAFYYQGQALGAGFVGPESGAGMFLGWNAVLTEINLGIFQLGAGPSVDVTMGCDVEASQGATSTSGCFDGVAAGLATRAALRFGMFTLSVDLHATFNGPEPMVWGLMGVGMQLGDVPREPMRFAATDRSGGSEPIGDPVEEPLPEAFAWTEPTPPARRTLGERTRLATAGLFGRALDDPYDPTALPDEVEDAALDASIDASIEAPVPTQPDEPARAGAPVRRFSAGDVRRSARRARARRPQAAPTPRRRRAPRVRGGLEFEGSDDPLEGLNGL